MLGLLGLISIIGGFLPSILCTIGIIYLAYKVTVNLISKFRQKNDSVVLAARVGDLVKKCPRIKLDDVNKDDVLLAEYDEVNDRETDNVRFASDADRQVRGHLNRNGGIVVYE